MAYLDKEDKCMKKLVLCSGGLDSTVLLHKVAAQESHDDIIALSVYYGQKHAIEVESCRWQCSRLGVTLIEADLSPIFRYNLDACALIMGSKLSVVHDSYANQLERNKQEGKEALTAEYVPYRNGLFLSFAAAVSLQLDCDEIFYGAHADDEAGSAYPDCSEEFILAQADAIRLGSASRVQLTAPWWNKNKADIVRVGIELGMTEEEFAHTWSCYEGLETPCGECGTCVDRIAAFRANGLQNVQ